MRYIHDVITLSFTGGFCDVLMASRAVVRCVTWVPAKTVGLAGQRKIFPALLVEHEENAERKLRRFVGMEFRDRGVLDSEIVGCSRLRFVDVLSHFETGAPILIYEAIDPRPMAAKVEAASNDLPAVSGEINGSEVATPVSSPTDHCDACAGVELAAHTHQEGA
jgi:hypothetical protein